MHEEGGTDATKCVEKFCGVLMVALMNMPELPRNTVICGDALAELRKMPSNSVDSIVIDPPAGISFMNMEFDSDKGGRDNWIAWLTDIMREALRVIKPGGHAFVWALPRTSHWTATALEDAGWEIRDSISHVYGSGFPKSQDVSKAIDKHLKAEREVIGEYRVPIDSDAGNAGKPLKYKQRGWQTVKGIKRDITAPATSEAARYAGYGSALKPAHEIWWLCRKPLSEPTIAQNVLRWGTGGLNIDASRVGYQSEKDYSHVAASVDSVKRTTTQNGWKNSSPLSNANDAHTQGRFPSNFLMSHTLQCRPLGERRVRGTHGHFPRSGESPSIFGNGTHRPTVDYSNNGYADADNMETIQAWLCSDDCPVAELDRQSGIRKSGGRITQPYETPTLGATPFTRSKDFHMERSEGTASRYFQQFSPDEPPVPFIYCSKPSRRERNAGCEELPEKEAGCYGEFVGDGRGRQTEHRPAFNYHPTVKSIALIKYLAVMVTPPGGVCLDMFAGSGTTALACIEAGLDYILVEQSQEYVDIACARIAYAERRQAKTMVPVQEFECHPSCPVRILGEQSGYSKSKAAPRGGTSPNPMSWGDKRADGDKMAGHNDEGYASRFFATFAPDSLWSLLEDEEEVRTDAVQ